MVYNIIDKVIIKEIFFVPGRDKKLNVSGQDIVGLINKDRPGAAIFIDDDKKIVNYLKKNVTFGDILVTVGIPPVHKIAERFLGGK